MSLLPAWLIEPLSYEFMQRALLVAVLVGIICPVMGSFLLVKRWSLLGDAISHAVLPGIVIAYVLGLPFFLGAVVTGLLTALGIGALERSTRIKSDAAMGILFIGAFALGLAIISRVPGHIDVFHILFGNVLGVRDIDLWLTAGTGLALGAVLLVLYKELLLWAFDPTMARVTGLPVRGLHYMMMLLLSVTIVASLQAVGIVLVVAMLITPAATAFLLTRRFGTMMGVAVALGILASVSGLYLSYYLDIASGATMVLVSIALFLLAVLLSPQEGTLWHALRRRRRASRIAAEDALKALHDLDADGRPVTTPALAAALRLPQRSVRKILRTLEGKGLARVADEGTQLTASGLQRARWLVRTHRLWETFLTAEGGRPWDVVHDEAHDLEHDTPAEVTEELAERLSHPERDPHGAPIPTREGLLVGPEDRPLIQTPPGYSVRVTRVDDENPRVLRTLARLGIRPGVRVEPLTIANGRVGLRIDGDEIEIDAETAAHIHVAAGDKP